MRWWGRVLVKAVILLTAFAIPAAILIVPLWAYGMLYRVATVATISTAVVSWALLILFYLALIFKVKRELNVIITKGVWISDRLGGNTEHAIDKNEGRIRDWDTSIEKVLKGTEYEYNWRDNTGLSKPEDESKVQGLEKALTVQRNYITLRILRLQVIRDSLRY